MQTLSRTYTVAQTAEALQVSQSTIRRLIKEDGIHYVRVHGSIRIPTMVIEELLAGENKMIDDIEDPVAYLDALTDARSEALDLARNWKYEKQRQCQKVQEWLELGLVDEYEVEAMGKATQDMDTALADIANSILSKLSQR